MAKKRLELDKNERKRLGEEIIKFYADEHDEDIGSLKADIVLDFVIDKLASSFYNQGLKDAQAHISNALEDLKAMEK